MSHSTDSDALRQLLAMLTAFGAICHPGKLDIHSWLRGLRSEWGAAMVLTERIADTMDAVRELDAVEAWEVVAAQLDALAAELAAEDPVRHWRFTAADVVAHAEQMGRPASEVLAEYQELDAEQEQGAAVDAAIRDGRGCSVCRHIWQVGEASRPAGFSPDGDQLFRCTDHCRKDAEPVRCVFCGRELGANPMVVDRDEATGQVDHACSDLSGCNDPLPEAGERS